MSTPCRPTRLAARAVILLDGRLLLVNAYPGGASDLWCAPGGGVEPGQSLPETLVREVAEETGLTITVGPPVLVSEFHDPRHGFHQVEVFFQAQVAAGTLSPDWRDPAGVVNRWRLVTRAEMAGLRFKPDALPRAAWDGGPGALYDPLEEIVP